MADRDAAPEPTPPSTPELPVGQPLQVRIGHSGEGIFKLRYAGQSDLKHDGGNIVAGTISGWRRIGLLSGRSEKARFFEIEPGDEEQEIAFLGYYLRGRFRVVRKENNARRSRAAYQEFAPA